MRRIGSRRRFRLLLAALTLAGLSLFAEDRIEAFAPNIRDFAQSRVEGYLDNNFKLTVGSIGGGIVRPLVFNDVVIKDKKGRALFGVVDINTVRTNFRIWDALLAKRRLKAYVDFGSGPDKVSGYARLNLADGRCVVKGRLIVWKSEKIEFDARIDKDKFDVNIKRGAGRISAKGRIGGDGSIIVETKVEHVDVAGFDLVCDATLANRKARSIDGASIIEGVVEAKNVILNYNPFMDFKASYKIADGTLDIDMLEFVDILKGCGKIELRPPYNSDISIGINNLNLARLVSNFGFGDINSVLTGVVNGKIAVKGSLLNPESETRLEARKGTIASLDFDYLSATLRGEGSLLTIEDSRVIRQSGYFILAGEIDFSKIGKGNPFQGLRLASDDRAINWDAFESSRGKDFEEINLKKKLNDGMALNFKKYDNDGRVGEGRRYKDEVRLEYNMQSNNNLTMMMGQDSDFFGFEHKDRF